MSKRFCGIIGCKDINGFPDDGNILFTDGHVIPVAYSVLNVCMYVVVVVVVFTLKTVLTSILYPSLSYSSRQRNKFPWSQANPK